MYTNIMFWNFGHQELSRLSELSCPSCPSCILCVFGVYYVCSSCLSVFCDFYAFLIYFQALSSLWALPWAFFFVWERVGPGFLEVSKSRNMCSLDFFKFVCCAACLWRFEKINKSRSRISEHAQIEKSMFFGLFQVCALCSMPAALGNKQKSDPGFLRHVPSTESTIFIVCEPLCIILE